MKWHLIQTFILAIIAVFLHAKPIDDEDLKGLLPSNPRNRNETLANIVQDPIIKNAVRSAIKNGSLTGLVVKKKVAVSPVNSPHLILSQREQVIKVPASHLEDVRKNITEENQESDQEEFKADADAGKINEDGESDETYFPAPSVSTNFVDLEDNYSLDSGNNFEVSDSLPKEIVAQKIGLPEVIEQNLPVPHVVPVLNTSETAVNRTQDFVESVLLGGSDETTEPDSNSPIDHELQKRHSKSNSPGKNLVGNSENMETAEDIIFRPLFRYRQEERDRRRYSHRYGDNYNYNRYNNYNRYRNQYYDDY